MFQSLPLLLLLAICARAQPPACPPALDPIPLAFQGSLTVPGTIAAVVGPNFFELSSPGAGSIIQLRYCVSSQTALSSTSIALLAFGLVHLYTDSLPTPGLDRCVVPVAKFGGLTAVYIAQWFKLELFTAPGPVPVPSFRLYNASAPSPYTAATFLARDAPVPAFQTRPLLDSTSLGGLPFTPASALSPPQPFSCPSRAAAPLSLPLAGSGTPHQLTTGAFTQQSHDTFVLEAGAAGAGAPGFWRVGVLDASPLLSPPGTPFQDVAGGCITGIAQPPPGADGLQWFAFDFNGPAGAVSPPYRPNCLWASVQSTPSGPTPNNATLQVYNTSCAPALAQQPASGLQLRAYVYHFWRGAGRPSPTATPTPAPLPTPPPQPPTASLTATGMDCPALPPPSAALLPAIAGSASDIPSTLGGQLQPVVASLSARYGIAQSAQDPLRRNASVALCPASITQPSPGSYLVESRSQLTLACGMGSLTLQENACYLLSQPPPPAPPAALTAANASGLAYAGPYSAQDFDCLRAATASSTITTLPNWLLPSSADPPQPFCAVDGSVGGGSVPQWLIGRGQVPGTFPQQTLAITAWGFVIYQPVPGFINRSCVDSVVEQGNFTWDMVVRPFGLAPFCQTAQRWGDDMYISQYIGSTQCRGSGAQLNRLQWPSFFSAPSGAALLPATSPPYIFSASPTPSSSGTGTGSGTGSASATLGSSASATSTVSASPTPSLDPATMPSAALSSTPTPTPTPTLSTGASPSITPTITPTFFILPAPAAAPAAPPSNTAAEVGGSIGGLLLVGAAVFLLLRARGALCGASGGANKLVGRNPPATISSNPLSLEMPLGPPRSGGTAV